MTKYRIKTKLFALAVILGVCLAIGFSPITPAKAHFALAYDFPSDNGNGIQLIHVYLNGTLNGTMYSLYPDSTAVAYREIEENANITLKIGCYLNSTYADVSTLDEGKNVIRHNVSVTRSNGTVVFSQNNFTYYSSTDFLSPLYFYEYTVILDFAPEYGEYYIATVTYEVFA